MGMKKGVILQALLRGLDKGRRDPRRFKTMVGLALMSGLVLVLGFGAMLYFVVGAAKDLVAGKPDLDLLAMERLINDKAIVLTTEQKGRLAPLLDTLATPGLAAEQAQTVKRQLLHVIDPAQVDAIEAWKATAAKQAAGLFALSPAVIAIIEEYTGVTREMVLAKIDALLTWWQLTKPANSAAQLQKTMQGL